MGRGFPDHNGGDEEEEEDEEEKEEDKKKEGRDRALPLHSDHGPCGAVLVPALIPRSAS